MKRGDSISDGEDVVGYVGGSLVNDYGIDGAAFKLSEADMAWREPGLSCNWLGYFANLCRSAQVDSVRDVIYRKPGRDAVFGELNIRAALETVSDYVLHARFAYKPSTPDVQSPYEDSTVIVNCSGFPPYGTHEAERSGDKIAKLV